MSEPRELPILFTDSMVRAIEAGRKTQTRRVINPQPKIEAYPQPPGSLFVVWHGKQWWWNSQPEHPNHFIKACPYGGPNDRLWIRQAWIPRNGGKAALYRSDYDSTAAAGIAGMYSDRGWRPSIHMPRHLCRRLLDNVSVRVERLNDISEADAKAEGVQPGLVGSGPFGTIPNDLRRGSYVDEFRLVWNQIHNDDGFSWSFNPYVWVVEFKPIQ